MTPKAYEYLLEMNHGYDHVVRSLKALAKYPALKPEEIRRFEQLARESCAATNTHLLVDVLSAVEGKQAGRLFQQRRRREQKDERG